MNEPTDHQPDGPAFIVEALMREGRVSEQFATYEEASRRVEQLPAESLLGLPMIFRRLPDGSERVVRDDGKPLQFHRVFSEDMPDSEDSPLSLAEGESGLVGADGNLKLVERQPGGWDDDLPPISLDDLADESP